MSVDPVQQLRWFGHVELSSGAVRTVCDKQIDGRQEVGRPKFALKKLTEKDCREWKLVARMEHLEMRCEICYVCS